MWVEAEQVPWPGAHETTGSGRPGPVLEEPWCQDARGLLMTWLAGLWGAGVWGAYLQ